MNKKETSPNKNKIKKTVIEPAVKDNGLRRNLQTKYAFRKHIDENLQLLEKIQTSGIL